VQKVGVDLLEGKEAKQLKCPGIKPFGVETSEKTDWFLEIWMMGKSQEREGGGYRPIGRNGNRRTCLGFYTAEENFRGGSLAGERSLALSG